MKSLTVTYWLDEEKMAVMVTSPLHLEGRVAYQARPGKQPGTFGVYEMSKFDQEMGEWIYTRDGKTETLRALEAIMESFG